MSSFGGRFPNGAADIKAALRKKSEKEGKVSAPHGREYGTVVKKQPKQKRADRSDSDESGMVRLDHCLSADCCVC